MMHPTVKAIKSEIERYYKEALMTENAIEQNREKMPEQIAEYENKKLTDNLTAKREKADAAIIALGNAALARLEKWAAPDGSNISADAKLLEYGVTPEQFSALCEKHRNNATMAGILNQYARRENDKAGKPVYSAAAIPTKEDRYNALKFFVMSAKNTLDMVDGKTGGIFASGRLADRALTERAVTGFGEEDPRSEPYNNMII